MTTREPTSWDYSGHAVKKIQFLIDANHVTVPQVADTIGMPHKALLDVLDGISHPTESVLRRCADYFGVTFEFITGQEAPAKGGKSSGSTGARPRSAGGSAPRAGGRERPAPEAPSPTLNVRTIATRFQALVELLIEKGVISAREYHERVKKVEERSG